MNGWLKLHRELIEKPIWLNSTPEQKTILITLLAMANFKENEWEWNGNKFKVAEGQLVTSLDSIVKHCGDGITIQNVRTALKRFEKLGFLTNKSTKSGRLITIENWGFYQGDVLELNKDANSYLTINQQSFNNHLTPNKEGKKEKNDNNVKKETIGSVIGDYKPCSELERAIKDFVEMRNTIKKKLTPKALKLILNKLDKLTTDEKTKVKILEQSIVHSWQGVFELKEEVEDTKQKERPAEVEDTNERGEIDFNDEYFENLPY